MDQWLKACADKYDDLRVIPKTYMVEENQLLKVSSYLHMYTMTCIYICVCVRTHTDKTHKCKNLFKKKFISTKISDVFIRIQSKFLNFYKHWNFWGNVLNVELGP